jgi:hypothetical protein
MDDRALRPLSFDRIVHSTQLNCPESYHKYERIESLYEELKKGSFTLLCNLPLGLLLSHISHELAIYFIQVAPRCCGPRIRAIGRT